MIQLGVLILSIAALPYAIYLLGILYGRKQTIIVPTVVDLPPVSIVISAYNEEKNIPARIKNLYDCNYPDVEITFVDDCSTDKTYEVAKYCLDLHGFNYHMMRNNVQLGTSRSYNLAIRNTRHDIIIITDADTTFHLSALHWMVARLTSSTDIGAVTGDLQPLPADTIASLESEYRGIYGKMCEWESAHDSTFNFNGALIAVMSTALDGFDEKRGADDANVAFAAIRNGYRAVYEKNAIVYESIPASFKVQFRQKVRRATGLLNSMWSNRDLLWDDRPFSRFYFWRMWMYFVSPAAFFIALGFLFYFSQFLFIVAIVLLLIPLFRAFILNQFYLLAGLLKFRSNVQTWKSTSSLEGKE